MGDHDEPILSCCRSDFEIATLGDIQVDGFKGLISLPAAALVPDGGDPDMKAKRGELITAVRGGQHMELSVAATTWRQRPTPNRRHLRLAVDKLADRAGSWKGKPFLTDHNTYSMSAAKGTILSSKLVEESAKVHSFDQVLHVVKPDAVIGVLDGTMRTFSIGWFALGPVMCSVHGVDVRGSDSCYCYPGDTVTVDGKPQVVQYEFSDYEGKEVSAVVVPAVRDTSIEGVRAALTAELGLHPRRPPPKESKKMAFTKLAAALALAALSESDEDRAVTAVTTLQQRVTAAELDAAQQRAEVTRLTAENARLSTEAALAATTAINDVIAGAYTAGKLSHGKDAEGKNTPDPMESLLRDFAKAHGAAALTDKIKAMRQVVPVGVPAAASTAAEAPKTILHAVPTDQQIRDTAAQLGVPENDIRAQYGLPPIAVGGAA